MTKEHFVSAMRDVAQLNDDLSMMIAQFKRIPIAAKKIVQSTGKDKESALREFVGVLENISLTTADFANTSKKTAESAKQFLLIDGGLV